MKFTITNVFGTTKFLKYLRKYTLGTLHIDYCRLNSLR